MKKRRLGWLTAGIFAAVLYVFENNPGTLTLLVGVLVLPILGAVTLTGKPVEAKLLAQPLAKKGESLQAAVQVENRSLLPRGRVEITLRCRNLHTGEEKKAVQDMSLGPRGRDRALFFLTCSHAGRVELRVSGLRILDPLGLFARRIPIQAEGGATILPETFPCALSLTERDPAAAESEAYALDRSGNDPGESFGLREYLPGDAIRRIHWKLSEKTDQLMVREFGQPAAREVALLWDRTGEATPEQTDAMTEILVSLSEALLQMEVCHSVFWLEEGGSLAEFPICTREDLDGMVRALLTLPPRQGGSLTAAFAGDQRFSHVVVVSGRLPEDRGLLCQGGRVSFLVPKETAAEGLQPDGSYVLGYEPVRYAADLCRMEV